MPISRYNPDGTVDIYNSKTGEVRTSVDPSELGSISPNLVAEYAQGTSPTAQLEREKAQSELEQIRSGEVQQEPVSAAEAKLRGTLKSGLTSLDRLEKKTVGDDQTLLDKLGFFGATTGRVGLPFTDAAIDKTPFGGDIESDILNVADAVLRIRTGAAAPETEVRRFAKIIAPQFFARKRTNVQKLRTARTELEEAVNALGLDSGEFLPPETEDTGLDDIDQSLIDKYKNQ